MRRIASRLIALGLCLGALPAVAQTNIALDLVTPKQTAPLRVTSPKIPDGQPIPAMFTDYGKGVSPPLDWSGAPPGTRSFAVIVDDPDVSRPPFTHWVVYDIPVQAKRLPQDIPKTATLARPKGAVQGLNSKHEIGYFGMHPPPRDPPHHYHFQVFALDTTPSLPPGADRQAVIAAMRGHVLADGELVGTFGHD